MDRLIDHPPAGWPSSAESRSAAELFFKMREFAARIFKKDFPANRIEPANRLTNRATAKSRMCEPYFASSRFPVRD